MIILVFALIGMIALVLCIVFLGMGGASTAARARNRADVRAARLDYRRLAREADAAAKARREASSPPPPPDEIQP